MTVNELIGIIRGTFKLYSDDRLLTDRYIFYTAWSTAKALMKADADKTKKIYNVSNIWKNEYLEMEEVSTIEDCYLDIPVTCTLYRSKNKLKRLVETANGWFYKQISSVDNTKFFYLVNAADFAVKTKIKYNKDNYVFVHNDYLYTNIEWDVIKVSGIYEDLRPCDPCESFYDLLFPLPSYLEEICISTVIQKLTIASGINPDEIANKESGSKII